MDNSLIKTFMLKSTLQSRHNLTFRGASLNVLTLTTLSLKLLFQIVSSLNTITRSPVSYLNHYGNYSH